MERPQHADDARRRGMLRASARGMAQADRAPSPEGTVVLDDRLGIAHVATAGRRWHTVDVWSRAVFARGADAARSRPSREFVKSVGHAAAGLALGGFLLLQRWGAPVESLILAGVAVFASILLVAASVRRDLARLRRSNGAPESAFDRVAAEHDPASFDAGPWHSGSFILSAAQGEPAVARSGRVVTTVAGGIAAVTLVAAVAIFVLTDRHEPARAAAEPDRTAEPVASATPFRVVLTDEPTRVTAAGVECGVPPIPELGGEAYGQYCRVNASITVGSDGPTLLEIDGVSAYAGDTAYDAVGYEFFVARNGASVYAPTDDAGRMLVSERQVASGVLWFDVPVGVTPDRVVVSTAPPGSTLGSEPTGAITATLAVSAQ